MCINKVRKFLFPSKHIHHPQQQNKRIFYLLSTSGVDTVNSENFAFLFRYTLHMHSFAKLKHYRNDKITISFTNKGKSCPSHDFNVANMFLMSFAKLKLSRKIPNVKYLAI